MRKALLVLALIAASFAGGAVVNGPGLAWLRANLGLSLLEIEAKPPASAARDLKKAQQYDPLPPKSSTTAAVSKSITPQNDASPAPPVIPKSEPQADARDRSIERARLHSSDPIPPKLEPPGGTAPTEPRTNELGSPESITPTGPPRPPAPSLGLPAQARAAEQPASGDWSETVRRMRDAGVQRYWAEGTLDGKVRFRCVVPLVGGSAIGQMFEAEGADLGAAADLVLSRVELWLATERE